MLLHSAILRVLDLGLHGICRGLCRGRPHADGPLRRVVWAGEGINLDLFTRFDVVVVDLKY